MPLQVQAEVLTVRRVGAYHQMTIVAPGIPAQFRPGHFLAVSVGGPSSGLLLRRAFSIYGVSERGVYGGTVDIVFAVSGAGTAWLADRRPHDPLDVVGPLGQPFRLPRDRVSAVLVGGGYGSAPLFSLSEALRAKGCRVDVVLGAATADRLFGALDAKRMSSTVAFTTDDGSFGERGRVSDVLPAVMQRARTDLVYACGPMAMLQAVARIAGEHGVPSQVAVEEQMACGVGVCMTCVLPVIGDDGVTRMLRSCTEGPVFLGDRVRFDEVGSVPADAFGAPPAVGGGH